MKTKKCLKMMGAFMVVFSVTGIWTRAMAEEVATEVDGKIVESAMVVQPQVERINGGFNPEYFGYRVEGLVLKGSNDCEAMGAGVSIHAYIENDVLYLVPIRVLEAEFEGVCPSISQPIFELAHIDVRYSRKEVQKVVIRNVGQDLGDMAFTP